MIERETDTVRTVVHRISVRADESGPDGHRPRHGTRRGLLLRSVTHDRGGFLGADRLLLTGPPSIGGLKALRLRCARLVHCAYHWGLRPRPVPAHGHRRGCSWVGAQGSRDHLDRPGGDPVTVADARRWSPGRGAAAGRPEASDRPAQFHSDTGALNWLTASHSS